MGGGGTRLFEAAVGSLLAQSCESERKSGQILFGYPKPSTLSFGVVLRTQYNILISQCDEASILPSLGNVGIRLEDGRSRKIMYQSSSSF